MLVDTFLIRPEGGFTSGDESPAWKNHALNHLFTQPAGFAIRLGIIRSAVEDPLAASLEAGSL